MPETPTIAFKEWSAICDALGRGRQTVILRKGGIHEGRAGFQFKHKEFALFPTRFHEQEQHVRDGELPGDWEGAKAEYQPGDEVCIEFWARLERVWTVTDWDQITGLAPFHIWDEATIRERFEWAQSEGDPPALNVAHVRVYRLSEPWVFAYEKGHGGCRSWLNLPPLPEAIAAGKMEPVLPEDASRALGAGLAATIS